MRKAKGKIVSLREDSESVEEGEEAEENMDDDEEQEEEADEEEEETREEEQNKNLFLQMITTRILHLHLCSPCLIIILSKQEARKNAVSFLKTCVHLLVNFTNKRVGKSGEKVEALHLENIVRVSSRQDMIPGSHLT